MHEFGGRIAPTATDDSGVGGNSHMVQSSLVASTDANALDVDNLEKIMHVLNIDATRELQGFAGGLVVLSPSDGVVNDPRDQEPSSSARSRAASSTRPAPPKKRHV